jgi:hypothetical protein
MFIAEALLLSYPQRLRDRQARAGNERKQQPVPMEVSVRMPSQPHSVAALNAPLELLNVAMEGYKGPLEDNSAYATLWDRDKKVDGSLLGTVRIISDRKLDRHGKVTKYDNLAVLSTGACSVSQKAVPGSHTLGHSNLPKNEHSVHSTLIPSMATPNGAVHLHKRHPFMST